MKQCYTYWSCKMGNGNQMKGLWRMKLRNKWISDVEEGTVYLWNPFYSHWSMLNGFSLSFFLLHLLFLSVSYDRIRYYKQTQNSVQLLPYIFHRAKKILHWYLDCRWIYRCRYLMYLLTSVCVVASNLESWLDKMTDRLPFHILASRNLCCSGEFQLYVPRFVAFWEVQLSAFLAFRSWYIVKTWWCKLVHAIAEEVSPPY